MAFPASCDIVAFVAKVSWFCVMSSRCVRCGYERFERVERGRVLLIEENGIINVVVLHWYVDTWRLSVTCLVSQMTPQIHLFEERSKKGPGWIYVILGFVSVTVLNNNSPCVSFPSTPPHPHLTIPLSSCASKPSTFAPLASSSSSLPRPRLVLRPARLMPLG